MSWSNKYLGIPFTSHGRSFSGVDCYGLLFLVYQNELAIDLPPYTSSYACADEHSEVAALINDAQAPQSPWFQRHGAAQPFDVLLYRHGRYASHIGIALGSGLLLHVQSSDQSKIERQETPRLKTRLTGVFHHLTAGDRQ